MSEFKLIKTTIDLDCKAGQHLIVHNGEIVAMVPKPDLSSEMHKASLSYPGGISNKTIERKIISNNRPAMSDAFDAEIVSFLKSNNDQYWDTMNIGNSIGLAKNDKPARDHLGFRLRVLTATGILLQTKKNENGRFFMYAYNKKGSE